MPGCIKKALQCFAHPVPTRDQHAPHPWKRSNCGAKQQLVDPVDDSHTLPPPQIVHPQEIIGTLLCCTRIFDSTMLVALGSLAASQSAGTQDTMLIPASGFATEPSTANHASTTSTCHRSAFASLQRQTMATANLQQSLEPLACVLAGTAKLAKAMPHN